ncbi:MAG: hypothetical protein WA064_03385 [Candidatus Moraniibacteriota bacterium]
MARAKKYQKKGTKVVIDVDDEIASEKKKDNERFSNADREFLEADRKVFIENVIKLNDIFEYRRKAKFKDAEALTRAKNILQSLVYLILNDTFYLEIQKIRKQMLIPIGAFKSEKSYVDWSLSHNNKKIYQEAEALIKKYKLCFDKDIVNLAPIIGSFISRRLKFNKFLSIVYSSVYEDALHCRIKSDACAGFVRGFEIDVIELEDSDCNFFTNQWSYKLFPFTKLTGIEEMFRDFFKREFYCEKNIKDYDLEYIKFIKKKLNVDKNKDKIKKEEKMEVIDKGDYLILLFITNYFTKSSDIINLYKKKKERVHSLLALKEGNIRKIQKLHLTEKFERNYRIWEFFKKGMPYDEIYDNIYGEKDVPSSASLNTSKGEVGEFLANIRDSIKRKIIF